MSIWVVCWTLRDCRPILLSVVVVAVVLLLLELLLLELLRHHHPIPCRLLYGKCILYSFLLSSLVRVLVHVFLASVATAVVVVEYKLFIFIYVLVLVVVDMGVDDGHQLRSIVDSF